MTGGCDIGLYGAGVMGAALALNMAEKGYRVALASRSFASVEATLARAGPLAERLTACDSAAALVAAVKAPRAIVLMVTAGEPVDSLIETLLPLTEADDLLIDAGNANFRDTRRRCAALDAAGRAFLGVGVSGGEAGARHGPAIMAGGPPEAWARVAPLFEAIAASHKDAPCCARLGPDGAGHFVKTVHNGIEYADMQLIAETYGLMRDGLAMAPAAIAEAFASWNRGPLQSYLIEVAAEVAATVDPETGRPLLELIRDSAGQKGTGRWTVIEAQELGVPATLIEAAVAARNLSAGRARRAALAGRLGPGPRPLAEGAVTLDGLAAGLLAGRIAAYDQGLALLAAASEAWDWDLELPAVLRVWRAGCIIRSVLLEEMIAALEASSGASAGASAGGTGLLGAPAFAAPLATGLAALRPTVAAALGRGLPVPALAATLGYVDTLAAPRGTADMIQGQRDYFGDHGFERLDREGPCHGPWSD